MVGHHQQQQEHLVQLRRDAVTTSWGFRLQGGQENNTPLTVQRVFVGGVSDGKLQRGDVVAAIGGQNARGMYHSQAEDIIRGAGHDISFTVLRGGGGGAGGGGEHEASFVKNDYSSYQLPWQTSAPAAPAYAPAPAPAAPSWIGGTSATADDADNEQRSFGDLRRQFSKPTTVNRAPAPSYIPKRPFIVKRPGQFDGSLSDPGWVAGSSRPQQSAPRSSRYLPLSPPASAHSHRPQQQQQQQYRPHPEIRHEAPESPAWLGTLRSAGGPRLWEIQEGQSLVGGGAHVPAPVRHEQQQQSRPPVYGSSAGGGGGVPVHSPRVQAARYGPGAAAPTYEQRSAEGVDSDTARVAHLQYNTPIGLYSKDSAREALEGQTRGKAGYGTMQITGTGPPSGPGANQIKPFDPAHSTVYRLVLEEDEIRKSGGVVYGTGEAPQQRPRGPNPAAQGRPSNPPPQQSQPEEPHSARFYQLVHENDDQAQEFAGVHPEQQYPFGGDTGVSDF